MRLEVPRVVGSGNAVGSRALHHLRAAIGGEEVNLTARSRKRLAAFAAFGLAALGGWSGLASAASPPTPSQLRAIGSSSKAARTEPLVGLGATPFTQPLIVVSFANNRASVLGGSAIGAGAPRADIAANVPISAVECFVNFTTRKIRAANRSSVSVRWFGGIACSRHVALFGQAFLAESHSVFDGTGNFYKGQLKSASSGRSNTIIRKSDPSLYVWSATNIFFQERPSRGVIAILPAAGQAVNAATACRVAKSSSFGFGVHCDLYSQRF
jgi:hypothetical protein